VSRDSAQPRSRPTFSSLYFLNEPVGAPRLAFYHLAMRLAKIFPFAVPAPVWIWRKLAPSQNLAPATTSTLDALTNCSDSRLANCLTDDKAVESCQPKIGTVQP
jgi:hypothetical protein